MSDTVLEVKNLVTTFRINKKEYPVIRDISFEIHENETLCMVGESGCGKSVTTLSIMGLLPENGAVRSGSIKLCGEELLGMSPRQLGQVRGKKMGMIFQEPMTSLNPVFPVGRQIMESFMIHQGLDKKAARARTIEMIRLVGIPSPEKVVDEYPHELSGGMRQRIMIAMALACRPKILIADEPTTALDVTIQAQIMHLLRDLKEQTGTAIILITHDLGVVAQIAQNVLVMYAGQAVEYAPVRDIYKDPLHPYTRGLLESIPKLHEEVETLASIPGMVPAPNAYPAGCRFSPRCGHACALCEQKAPPLIKLADGRRVRCWKYDPEEASRFE